MQPSAPEQPEEVSPAAASGHYRLDFGDKLKITFYDREDISKEYRVGEGGIVSVPTLGVFHVANQTTESLEQLLADAHERLTSRRNPVVVEIVERRPFFVVGLVSKPGPYAFQPGMTVLHAVAFAGGIYRAGTAGSWITTDITRETSKLNQARDELVRLHARRARLVAEREGDDNIALPKQIEKLAPVELIKELLMQERQIQQRRRATYERQLLGAHSNVEASKREVAALEEQRQFIAEQRKATQARLDDLNSLAARKLTPRQRVLEVETSLSNYNRQDSELSANIARSQRMVAAAEREENVLQLEYQMKIEEELGAIDRQISQVEVAFKASNEVVEQLSGVPSNALTPSLEANVKFEVLRTTEGSRKFLNLGETDLLLPGDILRVYAAPLVR